MILNSPLFLWNKVATKHLFIEVDSSQDGWGACVYQYEHEPFHQVVDEGRYRLMDKAPKRVVAWISKAHTPYEKDLALFLSRDLSSPLGSRIFPKSH